MTFADQLETYIPTGKQLFPYQTEDLYKICVTWRDRSVMLGHDMGCGKTIITIMAWQILAVDRILIVCPGGVRNVWSSEIPEWTSNQLLSPSMQVVTTGADEISRHASIVIVSYDLAIVPAIAAQLLSLCWDLAVFDECHCMVSPKAKRTKMCCSNLRKHAGRSFFLTGSIQRDKIQNVWPVFRTLCPEKIPPYSKFLNLYTYREWDGYGMKILGGKDLKKLGKIATDNFLIRRKAEDVLPELPDILEQKILLEIPELAERERQKQAKADFGEKAERAIVNGRAVDPELAKLRGELGLRKVPHVIEIASSLLGIQSFSDELDPAGLKKLAIFCYHRATYFALKLALAKAGIGFVGICGETRLSDRQTAVREFQKGITPVFLGSYAAAEGLTLTAASTVLVAEMAWTLSLNEQLIKRFSRIGQKSTVYIKYLLFKDTLDMTVYNVYKRKLGDKKRAFS